MRRHRAHSVLQTKVVLENGVIVEMKIWEIPISDRYPQGFKYSLFAVYKGETLIGYDNHYPKGPHKHMGAHEWPYQFSTIETLKTDFKTDLESLLRQVVLQ